MLNEVRGNRRCIPACDLRQVQLPEAIGLTKIGTNRMGFDRRPTLDQRIHAAECQSVRRESSQGEHEQRTAHMTTVELHLDDDLKGFVDRQSQIGGHSTPEAYIESLLAMEQMRSQSTRIVGLLDAAVSEESSPREINDQLWSELKQQVLDKSSRSDLS